MGPLRAVWDATMDYCAGWRPGSTILWTCALTGVARGRRISFGERLAVFMFFDMLWDLQALSYYSILHIYTDNVIVERTLANKCARSEGVAFWAVPLFESCYERKVLIIPHRITSENNVLADFGTRMKVPGVSSPSDLAINKHIKQLFEERTPSHVPHRKLVDCGSVADVEPACPSLERVDLSEHYKPFYGT